MNLQESLDVLSDEQVLSDLRQSREDFETGDTYDLWIRCARNSRSAGGKGPGEPSLLDAYRS